MTTESDPSIEAAPTSEPAPRVTPSPESGDRLPQMIERTRRRGRRRRAPVFTPQEVATIDYKDVDRLRKLISDRGRIEPRRKTGLTAKDQRKIAREIKRARQVALLPYTAEHMRQTSRFRMVTRMAQRAMRAELDDAPPMEPEAGGAPLGEQDVDTPVAESPENEAPIAEASVAELPETESTEAASPEAASPAAELAAEEAAVDEAATDDAGTDEAAVDESPAIETPAEDSPVAEAEDPAQDEESGV